MQVRISLYRTPKFYFCLLARFLAANTFINTGVYVSLYLSQELNFSTMKLSAALSINIATDLVGRVLGPALSDMFQKVRKTQEKMWWLLNAYLF